MNQNLIRVSLRQKALYIETTQAATQVQIRPTTLVLLANAKKLGFSFEENLLQAINQLNPKAQLNLLEALKKAKGVDKNWTPLIQQWDIPTGENRMDHINTFLAQFLGADNGTRLQCGHLIPEDTFPLNRYNGCPFCGTPFKAEALELKEIHNLTVLKLWTDQEMKNYHKDLLASPVALDATQVDNLKILLENYGIPKGTEVKMKETLMLVIDILLQQDQAQQAGVLFQSPQDILRYLWYKHTGFLQIVEPKTIVQRIQRNSRNLNPFLDNKDGAKLKAAADLKLKFNRKECRTYANWINGLSMNIRKQCEAMHPKRSIWVRVIRALRLAEYAKRKGFERLAELLDVFYKQDYEVWNGKVAQNRIQMKQEETFALLKQRPGVFARALFSNMLWFGPDVAIQHFREVLDKVPSRLVFTLNMYADFYFVQNANRVVKTLGGVHKNIPAQPLLQLYPDAELDKMKQMVQDLSLDWIMQNLEKKENDNKTMFIDPSLHHIPIAIGDRGEHAQDFNSALQGQRFSVEGNVVRLFIQWGNGLPKQHLDIDLSCRVAYEGGRTKNCSYSRLTIAGCQHSGDIQRIPEKVGTAEYIDINIDHLAKLNAKYVTFTCNAYTNGSITPNLVVGWMNSKFPMKITNKGVAYEPSAVQHQITIQQTLAKGLVFGVLDVENREIIWMEMSFDGQVVQNLDVNNVKSIIRKLDTKLKIGELLELKADMQKLQLVDSPELADEVYDAAWANNTAQVSQLFLA
jgi:hypothetical protein